MLLEHMAEIQQVLHGKEGGENIGHIVSWSLSICFYTYLPVPLLPCPELCLISRVVMFSVSPT
jgi:hypothetical protein